MILICISTISAGELQHDQDNNIDKFDRYQGGNVYLSSIVGHLSSIANTSQVVWTGNETYAYDHKIEFASLKAPVLMYFDNPEIGTSIEFLWVANGVGIVQQFNMTDSGTYIFRYVPTDISEATSLYINLVNDSSIIGAFNVMEEKQRGASTIIDTGIDAMLDVVVIVVAFWTLIYYLFIFVIVLAGIGLFVGLAFKIVEWAERFADKRKKHVYDKKIGGK